MKPDGAGGDGLVRPKYRWQCLDGPRPCPWVSCRYHLMDLLNPNFIKKAPTFYLAFIIMENLPQTCALDVADGGGATLQEIGNIVAISRERVRQIEAVALKNMMKSMSSFELDKEDLHGR